MLVTAVGIKTAAKSMFFLKKSGNDDGTTCAGRCLYSYRKTEGIKQNKNFTPKFPRIWSQLRTGYCLNKYRHKHQIVYYIHVLYVEQWSLVNTTWRIAQNSWRKKTTKESKTYACISPA